MARALLRWAVQGVGLAIPPLLTDAERALLHEKATELAGWDSEGAWAAAELLELFPAPPATC